MFLPASHLASLLLLALTLLCWGSWANTFKSGGKKWRFELYYFDFAVGVMLAATIAAATLGTFGFDGFSFLDDVRLAGKRQDLFALLGGGVFNLGNMLLVAAISVTGMSVAFPISFGTAMIIGALLSFFRGPAGNALFRAGGIAALILTIVVSTLAWRAYANARLVEMIQTGKTRSTKKVISSKGIVLGVVSGVVLGLFYPLLQLGREAENGLGPYSLGFVFAAGILFSTFVYNLFFMNLPVVGQPVDATEYFTVTAGTHGAGILGGFVWFAGALASFVAYRAEGAAAVTPGITYLFIQGAVAVAAIWGLLYWKELSGTDTKVNYYVVLILIFLLLGTGLLSSSLLLAAR